ncbi:uncharacterized protein LOC103794198 [Callithrix jacchus]
MLPIYLRAQNTRVGLLLQPLFLGGALSHPAHVRLATDCNRATARWEAATRTRAQARAAPPRAVRRRTRRGRLSDWAGGADLCPPLARPAPPGPPRWILAPPPTALTPAPSPSLTRAPSELLFRTPRPQAVVPHPLGLVVFPPPPPQGQAPRLPKKTTTPGGLRESRHRPVVPSSMAVRRGWSRSILGNVVLGDPAHASAPDRDRLHSPGFLALRRETGRGVVRVSRIGPLELDLGLHRRWCPSRSAGLGGGGAVGGDRGGSGFIRGGGAAAPRLTAGARSQRPQTHRVLGQTRPKSAAGACAESSAGHTPAQVRGLHSDAGGARGPASAPPPGRIRAMRPPDARRGPRFPCESRRP